MIGRATLSENSVIASPMLFFNPLNGKKFYRTPQCISAGGAEEVAPKLIFDIRSILHIFRFSLFIPMLLLMQSSIMLTSLRALKFLKV